MDIILVCFQVVVLVNDGSNEFSTKVSPRQGLCAGNWHRITGENLLINTQTLTYCSDLICGLILFKSGQYLMHAGLTQFSLH